MECPEGWGFPNSLGFPTVMKLDFFCQKFIILGRESAEELTPSDKENLRGRILQIFEEDENVEVYMEENDKYICLKFQNVFVSNFEMHLSEIRNCICPEL